MPATTFTVARTNPRFSFIAEAELAELVDGPRIVARVSELSSRGCYVDTFNPFPVGTVLRVRIRYGCSTCELPGNVIYTHTTAWACVLVRPQRRIAPRSTPGWKNSLGNRPDPRRHKSYLPNHAKVLAACGLTLTCNHMLQSK